MGADYSAYLNLNGAPGENLSDWMSKINDRTPFTHLSIPGSHRSASWNISRIWQCQSWKTDESLLFGLRFFDIHLCESGPSTLVLCHSNYSLGERLRPLLNSFVDFLKHHPSEFILCRITEDYRGNIGSYFAETFWQEVKDVVPESMIWEEKKIPKTVGVARGKIIFLRDFCDPFETFVPYHTAVIRDYVGKPSFVVPYWNALEAELNEARLGDMSFLYITYTSREDALIYPRDYANWINNYLYQFLERYQGFNRWGIIAMDFPGGQLVKKIIDSNFE